MAQLRRLQALVAASLAGTIAFVVGCNATAAAARYKVYVNVRYHYAICYPTDLLHPQGEADNSDGQTFRSRDGAELSVFGRNNVDGSSLQQTVDGDSGDIAGPSGVITYRAHKADWSVYSGRKGVLDFYSKTIRRKDQFLIFELTYPHGAAAAYRPVIQKLIQCFVPTH